MRRFALRKNACLGQSGFALIEVLVSLLLLGMAMVSLLTLLSSNMNVSAASGSITTATLTANQALERSLANANSLVNGNTVTVAGRYRTTVTVADAGLNPWPKLVTATVQTGDVLAGGQRAISVSTIVNTR